MMLKTLAVGLMTGLMMQAATARPLDEIRTGGTLNVVTAASSPPHGFKNPETNQLEGIMVDVVAGVAKHMKLKTDFTLVPFAGLIPTLTSGRVDVMSGPLFITEERAKVVDFSLPVYEWGEGVVVKTSAPKPITRFEDMQGHKVGVLVDSVQFNMIKDMPGATVSTYPDYVTLLADLRAGRIDLGVVDPPSIVYQIKSHDISGVKLDTAYKPQKIWQVGMAVVKGNATLLKAVNDALTEMRASGEMAEIGRKWGVADMMSE